MKILVMGADGFIGNRLRQEMKEAFFSNAKIYSLTDAEREIEKYKPDILINCIGYTGSNVEDCELNKEKTLMCNTFIPLILAEVCLANNIKFVHISTGCLYQFDYYKDLEIEEEQIPDFLDLYYCRSKIYSETALSALLKQHPFLILRFRIPLDNRSHPKNLLNKLVMYKKVIDLPNSITYIPDFINALKHLINIEANGIYNIVNKGGLKYPELMEIYKKYVPDFKYETITYGQLNLIRTNLILSVKKLENTGFVVRDIHEVLEEAVLGTLNKG